MDSSSTDSATDFAFAFDCDTFSDRILRLEMIAPVSSSENSMDRKRAREDETQDLNNRPEETMVTTNQDSHSGSMSNLFVKEIHISSPILAAQSPFFLKLTSKSEPGSKLTLKIHPSEENAVMELLRFMYTNSLSVKTTPELLHVLIAADKFDVALCINYCSRMLLNMPMTPEFALLLLRLPSSVLMADSADGSDGFTLVGIKTMLKSDNLQFMSEDDVYDLVLEWAKSNYSAVEERKKLLDFHFAEYIRFPHMTCRRLMRILTADEVKPNHANLLVLRALNYKAESLSQRRILATQYPACGFVERAYIQRPIKVVEFEFPHEQCIVYWDIKRKECEGLYPVYRLYSQGFVLGGGELYLTAKCNQVNLNNCFALFVGRKGDGSERLKVNYEFSARWKAKEEFTSLFKGYSELGGAGTLAGCTNLFQTPWHALMANDCLYFINDVLHLRADINIRKVEIISP
ncbi:unnamed protein product [Cochlearia groenlandica]